jgi:hypothetical protein
VKINPILIVHDHLDTLRDFGSNKRSRTDIVSFYGVPALLAFGSYWVINLATNDFYNVSITFFGIFIALLLNIQVAVFGVFQHPWQRLEDERSAEIQQDALKKRLQLLQEINSNISYAVLLSCLALFVFLGFYGLNLKLKLSTSISVFIYLHFLLTLLMIIKRFHALFRKEYQENNG